MNLSKVSLRRQEHALCILTLTMISMLEIEEKEKYSSNLNLNTDALGRIGVGFDNKQ